MVPKPLTASVSLKSSTVASVRNGKAAQQSEASLLCGSLLGFSFKLTGDDDVA